MKSPYEEKMARELAYGTFMRPSGSKRCGSESLAGKSMLECESERSMRLLSQYQDSFRDFGDD